VVGCARFRRSVRACPASFCAFDRSLMHAPNVAWMARPVRPLMPRSRPRYRRGQSRARHRIRSAIWIDPHPHSGAKKNGRSAALTGFLQIGQLIPKPLPMARASVCAAIHNGPAGSSRPTSFQRHRHEKRCAARSRTGGGLFWASAPDPA